MSELEISQSSASRMGREQLSKGRIIGCYIIEDYIGHGGYSDIYMVTDPKTRKLYAIKIEEVGQKKTAILKEMEVFKGLSGVSRLFPDLIKMGSTEKYHYITMEMLGPSLSQFKRILPNRHYSVPTSIRISKIMLSAIQVMHEKGYIHRDIKPGNFLIRGDDAYPIVLIDFGLSKKYVNEDGSLIPDSGNRGFAGTSRYATVKALQSTDLSRRDDLMSWFYSVLELVDGKLPWDGVTDKKKAEQIKQNITTVQLCSSLPEEYRLIYEYLQTLQYETTPDYKKIFQWINAATIKEHCEDYPYEWLTMPKDQIRKVSKINLVPPQFIRYSYKSADPDPKPIYKARGQDAYIELPKREPAKPFNEFDIGVQPLNVEDYRKTPPPSPFVKGPVDPLPSIPRQPKQKKKKTQEELEAEEYDSDEDEPKHCRI